VTPLAGVAAVLLAGGLPGLSNLQRVSGMTDGGVAVLATDYSGTVCGVRVSP
jgi:hypothetical protein